MVGIGIGSSVDQKELQAIADGHYLLVKSFDLLAKTITDVMDLVCIENGNKEERSCFELIFNN